MLYYKVDSPDTSGEPYTFYEGHSRLTKYPHSSRTMIIKLLIVSANTCVWPAIMAVIDLSLVSIVTPLKLISEFTDRRDIIYIGRRIPSSTLVLHHRATPVLFVHERSSGESQRQGIRSRASGRLQQLRPPINEHPGSPPGRCL